jgi:hypothetical protein
VRLAVSVPLPVPIADAIIRRNFFEINALQQIGIMVIVIYRWLKGVLNAPDEKRPHQPCMGELKG